VDVKFCSNNEVIARLQRFFGLVFEEPAEEEANVAVGLLVLHESADKSGFVSKSNAEDGRVEIVGGRNFDITIHLNC
jgi:hypothetical protein